MQQFAHTRNTTSIHHPPHSRRHITHLTVLGLERLVGIAVLLLQRPIRALQLVEARALSLKAHRILVGARGGGRHARVHLGKVVPQGRNCVQHGADLVLGREVDANVLVEERGKKGLVESGVAARDGLDADKLAAPQCFGRLDNWRGGAGRGAWVAMAMWMSIKLMGSALSHIPQMERDVK